MTKRVAIVYDERFMDHETGPHPECPERVEVISKALRKHFGEQLMWISPRSATEDEILLVHSESHLRRVQEICVNQGGGYLDRDTPCSEKSFEVARLAAGAALTGMDLLMEGQADRVFAVVRPPCHHASRDRAAGFCLFNNTAICAEYGRSRFGCRRVAILDWDVHHGNGTEALLGMDPNVLFVSWHQWPQYPGTGGPGSCEGMDTVLNLPLPRGATGSTYMKLFEERVDPLLHYFKPEIIIITTGFDAGAADPLGGMLLEAEDFRDLAARACQLADEFCGGRVLSLLAGGYSLSSLGQYAIGHVRGLKGLNGR